MTAKRQPLLPGFGKLAEAEFGGSRLRGNAREARPISTRRPIHLVMRSDLAKGHRSFLEKRFALRIEDLVRRVARKKGVKLYRYANAGNHLHLLVLPGSRKGYQGFIRAITGLVPRMILGTERGKPLPEEVSFWDARPFTRIVEWGRDFKGVGAYLLQNKLEALGFVPYLPRGLKKSRARAGPTAGPV